MTLSRALLAGMKPAEVYMEMEKDRVAERELMIAHLAISAFDNFDSHRSIYSGRIAEVAGFTVETGYDGATFLHPFSARPKGIVEKALAETFPEQHHLFTNASVDTEGYVTVRGIRANDVLRHPYTVSCFGLEPRGEVSGNRMTARLAALSILGLPAPSQETMEAMQWTMSHNRSEIGSIVEEKAKWVVDTHSFLKHINPKEMNLTQFASLIFHAEEDNVEGFDQSLLLSQRLRFIDRHPGSEAIFSIFPPEDETLKKIRDCVQTNRNFSEVDDIIASEIGAGTWTEFVNNPQRFCADRIETDDDNHPDEPDTPSI